VKWLGQCLIERCLKGKTLIDVVTKRGYVESTSSVHMCLYRNINCALLSHRPPLWSSGQSS
jgi:hypothetical protein